jgi:hypothetical protein
MNTTLKFFTSLVVYPLWAFTGTLPARCVSAKPVFSFWYALLIYSVFAVWHWEGLGDPIQVFIALVSGAVFVVSVIKPRYAVMCFMAWAASDVIYLVTDFHEKAWDWTVFCIYTVRSIRTNFLERKKP